MAEKVDGEWRVNAWLMQAVNLYFGITGMVVHDYGPFQVRDKVPLKRDLEAAGVRVVPGGVVRYGAFLEAGAVVLPGFVNVGARVGAGSMVDTWATVGSCAQVGRNVHIAGGVGIGGVLEPPGARPNIVEDGVFLGSRCIVVEGVLVEEEAVLGANVCITASTPIIDVTGPTEVVHKGRVPARSVVIPGTQAQAVPGRHLPDPLRAHRRPAQREHRQEDLAQRGPARLRGAGVTARPPSRRRSPRRWPARTATLCGVPLAHRRGARALRPGAVLGHGALPPCATRTGYRAARSTSTSASPPTRPWSRPVTSSPRSAPATAPR